jgi:hypothetical protein
VLAETVWAMENNIMKNSVFFIMRSRVNAVGTNYLSSMTIGTRSNFCSGIYRFCDIGSYS